MKYKLLNPRNIAEGLPILSTKDGDRNWHEGDIIDDEDLPEASIHDLMGRGFLQPTVVVED